ncbi:MAG: hypothetical protein JWQ87_530 [Candidatus Sulfotelmatobacter sp.]|nr:hypothetical protein [Candidatus Sulfotelmatobacter sp.]
MPLLALPISPARVLPPNVDIKHLPQDGFFRKRIAYEVESNIATKGAPRTHKVMLGLGFQNEFRAFHGTHNVTRVIREQGFRAC